MYDPEQITYFAETDARNRRIPFGIKAKDRTRHLYVIGKTAMGKSTLLENLAIQDLKNGNGMCFIDPHGKTADLLLEYIPEERKNDVLYFAPFDIDYPVSFNVMEDVGYDKRHLVVSGLMSSFKKIWQDAWSARMEYILSNALLALLEYPDSTLLSVNKMLSDKKFREKVVDNITDLSVKSFWVDEFAKYTDRFAAEATPAIQNKIGQFTSNPIIRNIIGQPKSTFDFREMMDSKKIIIINLSKGRIGETNAQLLGSMFVTKIYLAAMSRADTKEADLEDLPNFYLYVDEFQSFANESFADILSEARKYKLSLNIAHQYIEQMPEEVRSAVFGNVGTMITFRVGATDAEYLEKEFAPVFLAQDIVGLGKYQMYLRLMIDNVGSQPFSAQGLPPIEKGERDYVKEIVVSSRQKFARPRDVVEQEIKDLIELGRDVEAPQKAQQTKDNKKQEKKARREDKQKLEPIISEETRKQIEEALRLKTEKKNEKPEIPDLSLEEESLSLQNLGKNNNNNKKKPEKNDPKQVSPENRGGLKDALAAALGESFNKTAPVSPQKTEDKREEQQSVNKEESSNKPPVGETDSTQKPLDHDQGKPKEIASEDLKAILEA